MSIAENLARVRRQIEAAARRARRESEDIALMAVSKTFPPERIREAYDAEWHLIGHLQTNKAAKSVELFAAVDSVDSLRLAQKLNASAQQLGKQLQILIEVNVGGEAAKSGVAPDARELEDLLLAAPELQHLEYRGLMTIPPFTEDPQQARPYFRKLGELRDQIAARGLPAVNITVLSMGMSHDFEIAIEEGSTCVRVGTAIFGERSRG
jgi:PLP dependent protein